MHANGSCTQVLLPPAKPKREALLAAAAVQGLPQHATAVDTIKQRQCYQGWGTWHRLTPGSNTLCMLIPPVPHPSPPQPQPRPSGSLEPGGDCLVRRRAAYCNQSQVEDPRAATCCRCVPLQSPQGRHTDLQHDGMNHGFKWMAFDRGVAL